MYEIRVLSEKWDKLSYFESRIWLILSKHIKMFRHCLKNENRYKYYIKRTYTQYDIIKCQYSSILKN